MLEFLRFIKKILINLSNHDRRSQKATSLYKIFQKLPQNILLLYNVPEDDIYNAEILKNHYETYNDSVLDYFKFKKNLLVINVAHKNAYHQFCDFLKVKPLYEQFSWQNKRS